ncbi:hypothetical protein MferCBS49748_005407 [Microsporum ferrugineum]
MPSDDLPASVLLSCSRPLSPWLQEVIRTKLSELNMSDNRGNEQKGASASDLGLTSQPLPTPRVNGSSPSQELLQQPSGPTPAPAKQAEDKSAPTSSCKLVEIGEFLVHLMTFTSKIASALVEAEDIKTYIEAHIQQLNKMHHLSDMDVVTYMSEKERDLNTLAARLEEMANETTMVWNRSPNPPYPLGDLPQAVSSVTISERTNSNTPNASGVNTNSTMGSSGFASVSPANSWAPEANNTAAGTPTPISMEAFQSLYPHLNRRGVGTWVCPHAEKCTKGGVRDGVLVVFERNSSFKSVPSEAPAAHLQKHEKAFKCSIPGCKNTTGFARIDQLKRHKIEVHHMKPEDVEHAK